VKKLVLTISIGDRPWFEHSSKSIRLYAEKIGADYKELTKFDFDTSKYDFKIGRGNNKSYLAKILAIQNELLTYDRIIFLDDTCVVARDCPDLFNVVPYNFFGAHNEGILDWVLADQQTIQLYEDNNLPNLINSQTYFNSGVMVLSRAHARVFSDEYIIKLGKAGHFNNGYVDQTYLNFAIKVLSIPYFALPCEFNKMLLNHETWRGKSLSYQTFTSEESKVAMLSKKILHINQETIKPGRINHAFIYHITSAHDTEMRINVIKKLCDLTVSW